MTNKNIQKVLALLDGSVRLDGDQLVIENKTKLQEGIHHLARVSALGERGESSAARFLTRKIALALGIIPASIHDLYMARGRGDVPSNFTVPAINLRVIPFNAAMAVLRVAKQMNAGAFIFEIARSEIGYTSQRPSEYVTNMLAAAIREEFRGPIFIQGDHFQVSAQRYADDPDAEIEAIKTLTEEAISAGFYNIDVDTSTLVDLDKPTVPEQQALNTKLSAFFTNLIREKEPEGVTISVGGEIGEVGGQNSTEEELRAYMNGFNNQLNELNPQAESLSKISIQTGTSHGGVVLPDGSIAEVSVDFDTLLRLSQIAREEYGMAGAVQHGASTLPEEAFGKFVDSQACEVHLATNFQNIFYDYAPDDLKEEIYAYLDEHHAHERKEGQTDEQFYYKTRKRALGPFKAQIWSLPQDIIAQVEAAWEKQFTTLFTLLGIKDTRPYVDDYVEPAAVEPQLADYLGAEVEEEDTSDLAD
jgi:fructose/tagatose bisphosphate aldolase